jgi:hypothetical protein
VTVTAYQRPAGTPLTVTDLADAGAFTSTPPVVRTA